MSREVYASAVGPPLQRVECEAVSGPFDPLDVLLEAGFRGPLFYMERPETGEAGVALGAVETIRCRGPRRFVDAEAAALSVFRRLEAVREATGFGRMPRLVGGFGFADECESELWRDFAPLQLMLPERQWITEGGRTVRITVRDAASSTPSAASETRRNGAAAADTAASARDESGAHWLTRAAEAIGLVETGRLGKIVLARRESREIPGGIDLVGVLRRLRARRPSCYTFCFVSGGSVFIGSSPETLLRLRDGRLEAEALAGTIARGGSAAADERLGRELLASAKERREHAAVVEGIRDALTGLTAELQVADEPEVRPFPEALHLRTRVTALPRARVSAFDLVAALHPTPAVCGVPRERARALLDTLEADRGWYTGGIGWLDASGDASFAVALRSGLLTGNRLAAWAGAGIVAGSDAARELAETDLKMRALLNVVDEVSASP